MNLRLLALWACVIFVSATTFAAPDADALRKENAELKQRLDKLEGQVDNLVKLLETKPATTPQVEQEFYKGLDDESLKKLAHMVAEENQETYGAKKPILGNLDIELYGSIRLDAAYDESSVTDGGGGSYVKWVDSEEYNNSDDNFTMTARRTRLGARISGPEVNGIRTTGKLEVDFSGTGSETSNELRMRLAYMNLDWIDSNFSLLAGQAWDVMSPLNAPTIDAGVLWWGGNLGTRRPQIRATKVYDFGGSKVTVAGAIARNIGWSNAEVKTKETGEDSGMPQFQGRIGLAAGKTKVGVSGHWGQQEYDIDASGTNKDFDSWSVNIDLTQPLNDWITLKGEAFCGQNLNMFTGGIGQGVDLGDAGVLGDEEEIQAKGGWIALCMKPWEKWKFNAGYGIDDVDADDVSSSTARTRNQTIFGNGIYALNKNTDIGMEVAYRKTDYKGVDSGDNLRVQAMFKYKF